VPPGAATTGYILLGILLEERDLVALFGDRYRNYRRQVGMLSPDLAVTSQSLRQNPTSGDPDTVRRVRPFVYEQAGWL
jgi:hypothetical protein